MIHFDAVQREAEMRLKASREKHPEAWNLFSAKVFRPPATRVRASRADWPVMGLVPAELSKKRHLKSNSGAQQTRKRQRVEQRPMPSTTNTVEQVHLRYEEEESGDESEDQANI